MKNHTGRLLLVLLIVGLSAWAYFNNPPPLGLDLKGGSSLTYQATAAEGELTPERVERAVDVIEDRLNAMGVAEISIVPTQQNELQVELPGRTPEQIENIKALIQRNGHLEFRIQAEATEERKWRELFEKGGVQPSREYQWVPQKVGDQSILVKTPERPLEDAYKRAVKKFGEDSKEAKDALVAFERVKRDEVFTGDQLVRTEIHQQTLQIVVFFEFNEERKPYFKSFTERNVKQKMAIILDGKVNSAPVINSVLPGEGIIEGGSPGFTHKEARELAIVLESGSTGINLNLSREESLGPSLGEVAIQRGLWSVAVGVALVVATMVFYYRLPGMVANFALVLNIVILMGVLAFFRAALTLPGIAGIVLTVGMAVDANVLIFERYREERHRGKSVTEAIAAGYEGAMSAIIDSNATTILTAIVLIAMGTGAVKGFGVTLTVGLLASMFTSVYVTRWIFDWAVDKGIVTNLVLGRDKKIPNFDYMRKRRWFTFPSSILMIVGALAYLARDDYEKRDLEFVGGQEAILQLRSGITPADAESRIKAKPEYSDASIVTLSADAGVDTTGGATNRFRVRAKADTPEKGEAFLAFLQAAFKELLVAPPYDVLSLDPLKSGGVKATVAVHTVGDAGDPQKWKAALEKGGFADVSVEKDPAGNSMKVTAEDRVTGASAESVRARIGESLQTVEPRVRLSDPMPSKSFLEKSRAEQLFISAVWAILVSLAIEIVYIRIRFADFSHGFAAVVAIVHDVAITLGAVAIADHFGLVYAKLNLVLIAAFLTLIGYSMNDNMVVFDRIREMLGKRRVVTSSMVNDAINLTLVRSIRTSVTVFAVVLAQSIFSFGTGSALEGFAFVMVIGVLTSMYSSIFIAAPLLLFLPVYLKRLATRPGLTAAMIVATVVGAIMTVTDVSRGPQLWIGVLLAFNIPIHFLAYFFPWLLHEDPDSLVREELAQQELEQPTAKPGI